MFEHDVGFDTGSQLGKFLEIRPDLKIVNHSRNMNITVITEPKLPTSETSQFPGTSHYSGK